MAKETAKIARGLLKAAFPGHTFSVRSKSSVDVNWIDGPSVEQVNRVLGPLEGKFYDGQYEVTSYKYSWLSPDGTVTREEVPGAEQVCFSNYLFTHRDYSEAFIRMAAAEKSKECGWDAPPIVEIAYFPGPKQKGTVWTYNTDPRETHHRWFAEHLAKKTDYPEEGAEVAPSADSEPEATCPACCFYESGRCPGVADMAGCDDFDNPNALYVLEDPEGDPSPEVEHAPTVHISPKQINIGPRPTSRDDNLHWVGKHVANLMGSDWHYEGNPEYRSCNIENETGYGIHLYAEKDRIEITGTWPRLVDEFNQGGYLYSPSNGTAPKITVSAQRDPQAIVSDIKNRFLPDYLTMYADRSVRCESDRRHNVDRLELLKKIEGRVGGERRTTFQPDRVHLYHANRRSWGTVAVDSRARAEAIKLDLPEGNEVVILEAIKHLFPSQDRDLAVAQLRNDQGAILAALTILRDCFPVETRPNGVQVAIESLGDAWNTCEEWIDRSKEGNIAGPGSLRKVPDLA